MAVICVSRATYSVAARSLFSLSAAVQVAAIGRRPVVEITAAIDGRAGARAGILGARCAARARPLCGGGRCNGEGESCCSTELESDGVIGEHSSSRFGLMAGVDGDIGETGMRADSAGAVGVGRWAHVAEVDDASDACAGDASVMYTPLFPLSCGIC